MNRRFTTPGAEALKSDTSPLAMLQTHGGPEQPFMKVNRLAAAEEIVGALRVAIAGANLLGVLIRQMRQNVHRAASMRAGENRRRTGAGFNELLRQVHLAARDSHVNGINFLQGAQFVRLDAGWLPDTLPHYLYGLDIFGPEHPRRRDGEVDAGLILDHPQGTIEIRSHGTRFLESELAFSVDWGGEGFVRGGSVEVLTSIDAFERQLNIHRNRLQKVFRVLEGSLAIVSHDAVGGIEGLVGMN